MSAVLHKPPLIDEFSITFVGHPFAPIGRGEDLRCAVRAAKEVGLPFSLLDLDQRQEYGNRTLEREFVSSLTKVLSPDLNIFFINGDEIADLLDRFPGLLDSGAYQIICPQWELENYPRVWAEGIHRFDEVWAPSTFVKAALEEVMSIPVVHIPLAVEAWLMSFLPRRYFHLPESSFLYLFFFDYSGYKARKNPGAVIEVFEGICEQLGREDIRLVLKTNQPWSEERFQESEREVIRRVEASPYKERIIHFDRLMTDNEVKNLVRECDCFLSLHRSEGFGRGLAEAMFFGKPVIGTGYSGNVDFMHMDNSYLVDYSLIPVQPGAYPHAEGQVWAEPDLSQAVEYAIQIQQDPEAARRIGRLASQEIRTNFSYRAVGLRYKERISQVIG